MPLRVNMAGVIPVIFAAALLALPQTIGSFRAERPDVHQPALLADVVVLPRRRGGADHHLHVLLHRGPVQPGRPGRQPAQERRLHPRHPPGPADRAVPRPRADPPDAARLAVPRGRRRAAVDRHQGVRLLAGDLPRARRHLGADRRRRRARHDAPDGVADDDALLRRVPAAEPPRSRSAGSREGDAGKAHLLRIRDPARLDGRHVPRRSTRAPSSAGR